MLLIFWLLHEVVNVQHKDEFHKGIEFLTVEARIKMGITANNKRCNIQYLIIRSTNTRRVELNTQW